MRRLLPRPGAPEPVYSPEPEPLELELDEDMEPELDVTGGADEDPPANAEFAIIAGTRRGGPRFARR